MSHFSTRVSGAAAALALLALAGSPLHAQTLDAPFADNYTLVDLGSVPGVPGPYGGITFLDNDTLLIGGSANGASGAIYQIDIARNGSNQITGFVGSATLFATAPEIDGGLSFGPGGVLFYTGYAENLLGQIAPGSAAPDKVIDLNGLGVGSSVGTLAFVPTGAPGAGRFKLASYSTGEFYDVTLSPDGGGTYDIISVVETADLGGAGPEGIIYVPLGSPEFSSASMLVSEYGAGRVSAYEVDAEGDPIVGTQRTFVSGLSGAEGAVLDPLTNDFLFSTFGGGNQVVLVSGFAAPVTAAAPEPGSAVLGLLGLVGMGVIRHRRRRR